ncbi:hypothetical protein ACQEVB_01400 [Pseudonocardia sp. CA-107938]|uniref:hypothetical protein n=1 Tax=Pseudonocardia sp. CA-107938 TaxID=3240021 RepID=UPI003D8F5C46
MRTFRVYRPTLPEGHYPGPPPDQPHTEGVVFSDGTCVTRWIGDHAGTEVWADFADFDHVHGHPEYGSYYVWFDGVESAAQNPQPGPA